VGEYVETVLVDGLHRHLGHVRSADIGRIHAGANALVKGSAAWVDQRTSERYSKCGWLKAW
jgi:hypothetical protein